MFWLIASLLCGAYVIAVRANTAWRYKRTVGQVSPRRDRGSIAKFLQHPGLHQYAATLLPILVVIFAIHSFAVEPFVISAVSMIPNMEPGDVMLVNKSAYGVRIPIIDKKIINIGTPRRNEIMAFHSPLDFEAGKIYVKRIIGLPGDRVRYRNRSLAVNNVQLPMTQITDFFYPETGRNYPQFIETVGGQPHLIILFPDDLLSNSKVIRFPHHHETLCRYEGADVECTVPAGHYFVMGDNRDNSLDSRAWGFVPDELVVGRAFFLGWSGISFKRFGVLR